MRMIKKAESLKQQIYTMLKEDILSQRYNEEDILNERKISEEFNVSRSPVREALKALESENLVEYIPYKGIIVKKMGEEDLKNIFQIRTALEVLAVELAIENRTEAFITRLEECHQNQKYSSSKYDSKVFMDMDVTFHGLLLEMAQNDLLTGMMGELRDKIRRFGMNAIFSGDYRYRASLQEHLEILLAVKVGNVEMARQKMQNHIQQTYESASAYVTAKKG
ncbi:GntR family transcriptional regulator [Anaerosinus massiliensis]|uniref:GntR family transcriptional regulator n=1 Tax=Massilibacillus massiliensis TaxID=1806837 RepID=UPI000DA61708|nr:GntR family transcriptional regulator [Massilibacillus massiliensis]